MGAGKSVAGKSVVFPKGGNVAELSDDARRLLRAASAAFRETVSAARASDDGDAALAADYLQRLVHISHVVGDPADVRALAAAIGVAAAAPPPDDDLADAARALAAVADFVAAVRTEENASRHSQAFCLRGELDPDTMRVIATALLAAAPRVSPPCNTLDNLFVED